MDIIKKRNYMRLAFLCISGLLPIYFSLILLIGAMSNQCCSSDGCEACTYYGIVLSSQCILFFIIPYLFICFLIGHLITKLIFRHSKLLPEESPQE